MMTMDSCSTDQSIGELDSLSCNDDVHENFVEEYSVRVEVYETEVTGSSSAGSAPVIKISGLSDSGDIGQECSPQHHLASNLKRSLGRLLGDKKTRKIGSCLPLSKSLQLLECHRASSMTASGTMSTCCMTCRNHKSQTTVLAPFGDYKEKVCTSRLGVTSPEERLCHYTHPFALRKRTSMTSGKTHILGKWEASCSNPPLQRRINGRPRKESTTRAMKQGVFSVPTRVPRKTSKKRMFASRSLKTANSHAQYLDHTAKSCGMKPHCCASREHSFESCSTKNGTARISRCSWESLSCCHVWERYPSSAERTYSIVEPKYCREADIVKKSTFQAASKWPVSRTSFDCFEETITTRLIPAPFTKSARPQVGQRTVCCYVHDDMKTSLKQAWGCTDLSIVHKILPPQQGNNAWTPVRPKCTEPMLREVYVSPCERYQGTISSMDAACRPMEPVGPVKLEQAMSIPRKARLTPSTVKLSTSRNPRCSVHKQTQTSPSQLELPNILKSLVDWIAFICQNPGAHTTDVLTKAKYLPHATSSQPGVTQSLQELLRTDSAVWWKLARQFHEGIAQFPRQVTEASASGRQKSYGTFQPRARMGGEGECAATRNENWKTKRPPVQRTELPRRLSSRLDLCIGANPCIDLEKDLVPQMNGSVVGHRRSCPIF